MPGPGPAEREDEPADLEIGVVSPLHRGDGRVLQAQDGQVGRRIATGERGAGGPAAGEGDSDVLIARDRVTGGDHDARPPDDAGRGNPPPRVDGDDRTAHQLDGGRQILRKPCENAHG